MFNLTDDDKDSSDGERTIDVFGFAKYDERDGVDREIIDNISERPHIHFDPTSKRVSGLVAEVNVRNYGALILGLDSRLYEPTSWGNFVNRTWTSTKAHPEDGCSVKLAKLSPQEVLGIVRGAESRGHISWFNGNDPRTTLDGIYANLEEQIQAENPENYTP